MVNEPLVLVYDGECPVCNSYVRYVRIRESVGSVTLLNARDGGAWVTRIRNAGLDLDEGMVLYYGGQFLHGADCLHMLALLSTPSGVFNRINSAIFRFPWVTRIMYPALRCGRNLLLRLLNRPKLDFQ
jgi:predicted DCC family thiol-disulfide oxidoreductase YuxK